MASDLFDPPPPSRPRLGARPFAGRPAAGPPAGNQAPPNTRAVRPFAARRSSVETANSVRGVTQDPDAELTAAEDTPAIAATPGAPMHTVAEEARDSLNAGATIDDTPDPTERLAASEHAIADSTGTETGGFVSNLTSAAPPVPEAAAWEGIAESALAPAEPPGGLAAWQDAPSPEDTVAGAADRTEYGAGAFDQGLVPDEAETVNPEGAESVAPDQAESLAADSTECDPQEPLTARLLTAGDEMDRIRESLDQELSRFALRPWERPHAPVPFPALEEALPNDGDALTQSGAENSMPGADQIDRPPAVLQTWHDAGYATPALERSPGFGAAAREALEGAAAFAAGAEIAVVLEDVARRLRAGEIVVAHGARTRDEAATLAAVLAAMLGDRT